MIVAMSASPNLCFDLRNLEPPEPMVRLLEALASAPAGSTIEARLQRRPLFLIEELNRRGQSHECAPLPDGTWRLRLITTASPERA